MKVIETQSALITDAEVLGYIRQVHEQGVLNHQYKDEKGYKLRGLRTVIKDLETCFTAMGHTTTPFATRPPRRRLSPSPRRQAQSKPHPPSAAGTNSTALPSRTKTPTTAPSPQPTAPINPPQSYGDERLPLELALRVPLPHQATPPPVPPGPRRLALDATASFYPASLKARFEESMALYDPTPKLYTPRMTPSADAAQRVAFVPEAVKVMQEFGKGMSKLEGGGRSAVTARNRGKAKGLTKGEMLMVCNLRPQNVEELDVLVEDMEKRLGAGGVKELIEKLRAVWKGAGWTMLDEGGTRGRDDKVIGSEGDDVIMIDANGEADGRGSNTETVGR